MLNSRTDALLRVNLQRLADACGSVGKAIEPDAGGMAREPSVSMRDVVRTLRLGSYRARRRVEVPHDKAGPTIRVRLAVSDDGIHVDLADSDAQLERPAVNSTAGHTADACLDADTGFHQSGAGGGWGSPLKRDPELVLADWLDDLVPLDGAKRDYGVVIDPTTRCVDIEATKNLRKEIQADPNS